MNSTNELSKARKDNKESKDIFKKLKNDFFLKYYLIFYW